MTAEASWDDPAIPSDDLLLRRVLRRPDHSIPDLLTGQLKVLPAALRLDPDGMSTQRDGLLTNAGISRAEIYDWQKYSGVEFPVSAARETDGVGVIDDPDDTDTYLGAAHSLVRTEQSHPAKAVWREARAVIADACVWMQEDPNRRR